MKTAEKTYQDELVEFLAKDRERRAKAGLSETKSNATSEGSEKKRVVNVRINDRTLKEWKKFCLDCDMTLTAAIKLAMNSFIKNNKVEDDD